MERAELVVSVILVLVSLLLGFGIYSVFFYPLSGEVRPRYKGGRQRLARWLKANGKRILLTVVLLAVVLGLVYAGLRYRNEIVEKVKALFPRLQARVESVIRPAAQQEPADEAEVDGSNAPIEDAAPPSAGTPSEVGSGEVAGEFAGGSAPKPTGEAADEGAARQGPGLGPAEGEPPPVGALSEATADWYSADDDSTLAGSTPETVPPADAAASSRTSDAPGGEADGFGFGD